MVWGLFAPKFVFDVVGLVLTDVLICVASLFYFWSYKYNRNVITWDPAGRLEKLPPSSLIVKNQIGVGGCKDTYVVANYFDLCIRQFCFII